MEDNVIRYTSKDKKIILFSCPSEEWENKQIANTYDEYEGGKLIFENDIEFIPEDAFSGNKMLKSIEIPRNVKRIESHAFFRSGLSKVTMLGCLNSIGTYAFAESRLITVTIPTFVKKIESFAFANCKDLMRVIFERLGGFPNMVKIEAFAFWNCPIRYISFPTDANVYMSDNAFYNTPIMDEEKARNRLLDFISYTSENTLQFK